MQNWRQVGFLEVIEKQLQLDLLTIELNKHAHSTGFTVTQVTGREGQRHSTDAAFLSKSRPNLKIVTHVHVERVRLNSSKKFSHCLANHNYFTIRFWLTAATELLEYNSTSKARGNLLSPPKKWYSVPVLLVPLSCLCCQASDQKIICGTTR